MDSIPRPEDKYFFTSYKLIPIIAIISILMFQLYWLKSHFEEEKMALFREVAGRFNAVILSENQKQLVHLLKEKDAYEVSNLIKEKQQEQQGKHLKMKIFVYKSKTQDANTAIRDALSSRPSIHETTFSRSITQAMKSLNINFQLYKQHDLPGIDRISSDHIILAENLLLEDRTNYAIVLTSFRPVIFKRMEKTFVLSFIYLSICIGGIFILYSSLKQQTLYVALKKGFTHNMTHELKTPISILHAGLESLSTYQMIDNKDVAKEYISLMKNEVENLNQMVDAILIHAQLENQKIALSLQPVHLRSLLSSCVSRMQSRLEQAGASILVAEVCGDIVFNGDFHHLSNVFNNLFDNSLKYGLQGTVIKVNAQRDHRHITIEVQDNGIGISKKYLSQIFDPYFRVPEHQRLAVKGYGLGLDYVRQIVHLHQGVVTARTLSGSGVSFIIKLPVCDG